MIHLIMIFTLLIFPAIALSQAELCGDPPPVANDELKGEIQGKAQFLSRFIGDAALSGHIQTSRTEIFSRYPDAETSRSNAYFEYQVCVLLMKDTTLTTKEKLKELKDIKREFSRPLGKEGKVQSEKITVAQWTDFFPVAGPISPKSPCPCLMTLESSFNTMQSPLPPNSAIIVENNCSGKVGVLGIKDHLPPKPAERVDPFGERDGRFFSFISLLSNQRAKFDFSGALGGGLVPVFCSK